jgi:hypothetical protein
MQMREIQQECRANAEKALIYGRFVAAGYAHAASKIATASVPSQDRLAAIRTVTIPLLRAEKHIPDKR